MVRCACCAGQWAHRDCVAYAMGQADRDAKDAAGLTSALGTQSDHSHNYIDSMSYPGGYWQIPCRRWIDGPLDHLQ